MRRALLLGFVAVLVFALCPIASFAQFGTNSVYEDHELPWGDSIQRNYNSPLLEKPIPGFGGRDLGIRSRLAVSYHTWTGTPVMVGHIYMTNTFTHIWSPALPNTEDTETYYDVSSQDASFDLVFTQGINSGFLTGWHGVLIWEDE
ncbi:hypothetical protein KQI52_15955 [bacterium]|nr:hypothetical protein [bacterium]